MRQRCIDCKYLVKYFMEWYQCTLPLDLWEVADNIRENVTSIYKYNKCPYYEKKRREHNAKNKCH